MKRQNEIAKGVLLVPESVCPVDFMIELYQTDNDYTFVLDKKCISDLLLGRMPKIMLRNSDGSIEITWIGKTDKMILNEINETHQYEVINLYMDNVNYVFNFDKPSIMLLIR